MQNLIESVFERFGTQALLGGQRVRVFFQPGSKGYKKAVTPLGQVPQGQYVCYFSAGTQVLPGDELKMGDKSYLLCRVEPRYGKKVLYQWALCRQKGGESL